MAIDNYLNIITSQHRSKPNYIAFVSSSLNKVDDISNLFLSMNSNFDVDLAIGNQLDIIGDIVGVKRTLTFQPTTQDPVMNDAEYRTVLKAKIAKNTWKGTIPQIYEIWENLFNTQIKIKDEQNMSMSVVIGGGTTDLENQLIANGYIVPKPMGVSISTQIEGTFTMGDVDDTSDINAGFSDVDQISGGTLGGFI